MWINADLGEGCTGDEVLFGLVDWANIACGGHAGDEASIRRACALALEHDVRVGAHPSYPDREGFGRRRPPGGSVGLLEELKRQVDLFENIAAQMGCITAHLKPHGQLYNDAAFQFAEAEVLFELMTLYPHLKLVALAQSPQVSLARSCGFEVFEEAFPDRAYLPDGALAPRNLEGAVIHDAHMVGWQAEQIIRGEPLMCLGGGSRLVQADTLCIHGDTPEAIANAIAVRDAVNRAW